MTKRTAEDNSPFIAKYGMPATERNHIVENHFVVMQERKLFSELHFSHAVRIAPALSAALSAALAQIGKD